MKTLIVSLFCSLAALLSPRTLAQGNDITKFYLHADSVCELPAIDKPLVLLCQKRLMRRYVSLVGFSGDSVARIVAVTLKPLTDPAHSISLTVDFDGGQPTPGKTSTWGYIFDRNGDGKVDYMALVGGAAAVKGVDFPDSFPTAREPLSRDQVEYTVQHCRLIFNQWADDNYDGTLDAVIHVTMDPEREWVDHRVLARSTHYDGKLDDARGFWTDLEAQQVPLEHSESAVPILPVGKKETEEINQKMLDEKTRIMQIINQAISECRIHASRLAR